MVTRWYTEPWAWLVFILPFCAVVAGIGTYIIANNDPDPLVVGEYYKRGKAINQELSKIKLAQKLGMRFSIRYQNDVLELKPTGIEKIFPLMNLNFYHPTLPERDFSLVLTQDANGLFRNGIGEINGKWRVTLTSFEKNWKIENVITLPRSTFIDVYPDIEQSN